MAMTYTCEGCGKQFTGTPEEAFDAGWDTPERFMSWVTCDTCPITVTLYWEILNGRTQLTLDEYERMQNYNEIYNAAVLKNGAGA